MEGSKLKVSDALSQLYSEEKHKISDVIPLNFLLHFTDYQLYKECDHLASKFYAHRRAKLATKGRCCYDRQVKYKPVERYEPPKAIRLQLWQKLMNANMESIDKPLTIKQDQEDKQVVNTIHEVPDEMYTPMHLVILPQDQLLLFRKHIPKQQEIDKLMPC